MPWLVLIISGVFEAVWALALDRSHGFSRMTPTVVFVVALAISMAGLAWAMKSIPVGTAYAVWVGIGASLTAIYGMAFLSESVSLLRVLSLLLVITGVVGLKLFGH